LRDAPESAHFQILDFVGGVGLTLEADFLGHLHGAPAENGGCELVARFVDQRARKVLTFADDDALGERGFERGLVRLGGEGFRGLLFRLG
jgi:hypothetical protein